MKVSRILAILSIFILTKEVYSQPKYNFLVGLGYYNPKIETSSPIPNLGFVGKNLLLNWGARYEIYPNVREHLDKFHTLHPN